MLENDRKHLTEKHRSSRNQTQTWYKNKYRAWGWTLTRTNVPQTVKRIRNEKGV